MKQIYIAQYVLLAGTAIGLVVLTVSGMVDNSLPPISPLDSPQANVDDKLPEISKKIAQNKTRNNEQKRSAKNNTKHKSIAKNYFVAQGDVHLARRIAGSAKKHPANKITENKTAFIRSPQKVSGTKQPVDKQSEEFDPFQNDNSVLTREASLSVHKNDVSDKSILKSPQHRRISSEEHQQHIQKQLNRWNELTSGRVRDRNIATRLGKREIDSYHREQEIDSLSPLRYSGKPSPVEYRLDTIWQDLEQLAGSPETDYQEDLHSTLNQLRQLQTNMRMDDLQNQLEQLRASATEDSLNRAVRSRRLSRRYRGQRYFFIGRQKVTKTESLSAEKIE